VNITAGDHTKGSKEMPRNDSALRLTIAVRSYPYTQAIKSGAIKVKGVELEFIEVEPQIAAYRRMVRDVEFDMCELAPTTYMIARAYGAPFKALPIFFGRRFHHDGLMVRPDSGIRVPKDLEGKKAGVRAYSVTTGVWTRGIFENEYGLDTSKVTWYVDDEEHVRELRLPPNVLHVPEGKSLASMIASGELQAGFDGNAGIGREGPPTAGWADKAKREKPVLHDLMPNAASEAAAWFKRTGIYPVHSTLVIKDSLLAAHPDLARNVYDAFLAAKQDYVARLRSGEASSKKDQDLLEMMPIVGDDPLPYGLAANRPTIQALIDYAYQQKLTPRRMGMDEVFLNF
jgi:4,5-dihydroxyphthalate decarboxylase